MCLKLSTNLECLLGFLYKDFWNNGYSVSKPLEKLGQMFWQLGGHLVVQLVSNYPSTLSCLLKNIFNILFFVVKLLDKSILLQFWQFGGHQVQFVSKTFNEGCSIM